MTTTEIHVLQGFTRAKSNLIRHMAEKNCTIVIRLHETHVEYEEDLIIEGFNTIDFISYKYHGIATNTRDGLRAKVVCKFTECCYPIEWSIVDVDEYQIGNIYKLPSAIATQGNLPRLIFPFIIIGDFNSRSIGCAMLAQLIRSLTANQKVPGSIPGIAMGLNI